MNAAELFGQQKGEAKSSSRRSSSSSSRDSIILNILDIMGHNLPWEALVAGYSPSVQDVLEMIIFWILVNSGGQGGLPT